MKELTTEEAERHFTEKMSRGWRPPKVKVYCSVCRKLRIVQPLYPTTKQEREAMKVGYVCSDHPELEKRRSRARRSR